MQGCLYRRSRKVWNRLSVSPLRCRLFPPLLANKAYLLLGEQNLGIKADLKIVSAETAHILDDNCADFPGFGFCKHCLKSGTVEVTPCVTVIFQKIVCKKFVILKIHINCNLCYSIEK